MEGLFRGIWYRSAVKLEKVKRYQCLPAEDSIVAVPPFEPYNPFDWYHSSSEIRQGKKSLYLEFLEVDANHPEEVASFCQRFGVLGDADKAEAWYESKGQQRIRAELDIDVFADFAKLSYTKNQLIGRLATAGLDRRSAHPAPTSAPSRVPHCGQKRAPSGSDSPQRGQPGAGPGAGTARAASRSSRSSCTARARSSPRSWA